MWLFSWRFVALKCHNYMEGCLIMVMNKTERREYNRKWRSKNKEKIRAYRAEHQQWIRKQLTLHGPCAHCRQHDLNLLLFHHIDPATKNFSVAGRITDKHILLSEIDLCIVLCYSCHRIHHSIKKGLLTREEKLRNDRESARKYYAKNKKSIRKKRKQIRQNRTRLS